MSCDLAKGRGTRCKDLAGGLRAVYFINYGDITGLEFSTGNTDVITDLGALTAYRYDLSSGGSSLTQNIQSSRETGTTFFEQVLTLTLPRMSADDNREVKLLAYGSPHVVVEDNNGNAFICGLRRGVDANGGTIVTGNAMNDLNGYTLTLTGMERVPANFLEDAVEDNPFAGMTSTVTIVTS